MPYTGENLTAAIRAILGDPAFRRLAERDDATTVGMMEKAILHAFLNRIDNLHTDVLREAWADCARTGDFSFSPPAEAPSAMELEGTLSIYADGACEGNPGPAGTGWVILRNGDPIAAGATPLGHGTNNIAELTAAIEALNALPSGVTVTLHTDSEYVANGMNEWMAGWKERGWRTANKKPVKNQDLWMMLDQASSHHRVTFVHVRAHGRDPNQDPVHTRWNDYADRLSVEASQGKRISRPIGSFKPVQNADDATAPAPF